jgi:hypothetical protein
MESLKAESIAYRCKYEMSSQGRACGGDIAYESFMMQFGELLSQHVTEPYEPEEEIIRRDRYNRMLWTGVLTRADLARLGDGKWLNDQVINTYADSLSMRDDCLFYADEIDKRSIFFSTWDVQRILDRAKESRTAGAEMAIRVFGNAMAARAIDNDVRFETAEHIGRIIFPFHCTTTHWCSVTVDVTNSIIKFLDSIFSRRRMSSYTQLYNVLTTFAERVWPDKKAATWTMYYDQKYPTNDLTMESVPQQAGDVDCGVFTAMFMDFEAIGAKIDFTQDDIQFFRQKIALTLLAIDGDNATPMSPRDYPELSQVKKSIERSAMTISKHADKEVCM